MDMFIVTCSVILICLLLSFYSFMIIANKLDSISEIKECDFFDIYTYTKREFNINCPKIITESIIIEKCGNVNNIWNGLPHKAKTNITDWSLVFALYYISKSKIGFNYNMLELIKLKWKYRTKYLLIKFTMR